MMPELPEVECVRRSLASVLIGARVVRAAAHRPDVLRIGRRAGSNGSAGRAMLAGQRIERIERHGKQLAIVGETGGAVCIHLGMSGQLRYLPRGRRLEKADHVHCTWWLGRPESVTLPRPLPGREGSLARQSVTLPEPLPEREGGFMRGRLVFRDPRRFGGVWAFDSFAALRADRWARLGPDAMSIRAGDLAASLAATKRAIKSVLLDQRVIAGVGNIYADEILFAAGIHPERRGCELDRAAVRRLAAATQRIMREAVACGGTTLRDYADGRGVAGTFASRHRVYGRAGEDCWRCGGRIKRLVLAQRSTCWCDICQS